MEFNKEELLKIYVAMADSEAKCLGLGIKTTQVFADLQEKIREELTK